MRYIFINFINTLRHYKASSLLNIIGMAVAFAAFYIILTQVMWGMRYNKEQEDSDRIFLLTTSEEGRLKNIFTCRPYAERTLSALPEVESFGAASFDIDNEEDDKHYIKEGGKTRKFSAVIQEFTQGALTLFKFEAEQGSFKDLAKPHTVAVSAKFARENNLKIGDRFSDSPADNSEEREIVALWKDKFPEASSPGRIKMLRDLGNVDVDDWQTINFKYFVKLKNADAKEDFEKHANEVLKSVIAEKAMSDPRAIGTDSTIQMNFIPLSDIYYRTDIGFRSAVCQEGNKTTDMTLLTVAILIIVIAMINFINFFFALVPARIRSVNTYKVYGTSRATLVGNFVMESVGLVVIALLFSLVIILLFERSSLSELLIAPINFASNVSVLLLTVSVTLIGAVVGSLYPAFYITSFQPAFVLKGRFGSSMAGRTLRNVLIGVQFVISIGLIICSSFIRLQQSYMMNYDMGFNRQYLISGTVPKEVAWFGSKLSTFEDRLRSNPDIEDITWAGGPIVAQHRMTWGKKKDDGKRFWFSCYPVAYNFLDFMGIGITEGRDFTMADEKSEYGAIIFTEPTQKEYGKKVGDYTMGATSDSAMVVGVCKHFRYVPLQHEGSYIAFYVWGKDHSWGWEMNHLYVRTTPGADPGVVMDFIRKTAIELAPEYDSDYVDIDIFDNELASNYEVENNLNTMITIFTFIAIIISLMGVFGLVLFETQHRKKEIAIMRVMGAGIEDVLRMFCLKYAIIVIVCFVIVSPLCWLIIQRYFSTFAHHTDISWWVFAVVLLVVLAMTILVVAIRCLQTAFSNPVDSIKSE